MRFRITALALVIFVHCSGVAFAAGVVTDIPLERQVILTPSEVVPSGFSCTWEPQAADVKEALNVVQSYIESSTNADHVKHVCGWTKREVRESVATEIRKILSDKAGYCVQFVGTTNKYQMIPDVPRDQELIYCNFIPFSGRSQAEVYALQGWRHRLLLSDGGGYQYWHVLYDPKTRSVVDFYSNLDAANEPKRAAHAERMFAVLNK